MPARVAPRWRAARGGGGGVARRRCAPHSSTTRGTRHTRARPPNETNVDGRTNRGRQVRRRIRRRRGTRHTRARPPNERPASIFVLHAPGEPRGERRLRAFGLGVVGTKRRRSAGASGDSVEFTAEAVADAMAAAARAETVSAQRLAVTSWLASRGDKVRRRARGGEGEGDREGARGDRLLLRSTRRRGGRSARRRGANGILRRRRYRRRRSFAVARERERRPRRVRRDSRRRELRRNVDDDGGSERDGMRRRARVPGTRRSRARGGVRGCASRRREPRVRARTRSGVARHGGGGGDGTSVGGRGGEGWRYGAGRLGRGANAGGGDGCRADADARRGGKKCWEKTRRRGRPRRRGSGISQPSAPRSSSDAMTSSSRIIRAAPASLALAAGISLCSRRRS